MQVLHVMSFLIERVGADIVPHSQALMQHLPSLWQESEEHNLLRCAIVTTLVNLIEVSYLTYMFATTLTIWNKFSLLLRTQVALKLCYYNCKAVK